LPSSASSGRSGQDLVVIPVREAGGLRCRRAQRVQLAGRVLPDALQQPVPAGTGPGAVELHQALVHQRPQQPQDPGGGHLRARGDCLCAGQAEPPGEGRQAGQHRLLRAGQQHPGPVHHGPQRPLSRQRRRRPAGQQRESLIQPFLQLGRWHPAQPRGGQLDGQRDAIQPPADPPGHRGSLVVLGQRHALRRRPVGQQPDRLAGPDLPGVVPVGRNAHRRHPVHVLPADAQRLPAGGQQGQVRAAPQQRVGQLGARPDHVLAVVQQHQQAPPAHRLGHRVHDRAARLLSDAQHVGHRQGHQIRIAQRRQIGEPNPVSGAVQQPGR
jgi:hypothetical protein